MGKKKKQEKQKQEKQEKLKKQKDKLKKQEKQVKQEKAERKLAKAAKEKREKATNPVKTVKTRETAKASAGRRKKTISASNGTRIAAERFRALGDENRLRILALLEERELCAGDILKSMSIVQSTLSHHMKILVESGLVTCRKQGKWSYYSISRDLREELDGVLGQWIQD